MAGQRNKNKKSKNKNKNKNRVRGEPPQALVCPITLDLMRDPVMDANGHTFDRSAIERSLVNQPGICPLTNERYPNGDARMTPNRAVRSMIDAFNEAADERLGPEERRRMAEETERNKRTQEQAERRRVAETPRRAVDVAELERDGDLRGLVQALGDTSVDCTTKAHAAEVLRNLMAADNDIAAAIAAAGAIPPLVELLRTGSDECRAEAAGALHNLAIGPALVSRDNDITAAIVAAGAIPLLVKLLGDGLEKGRAMAAGTLGDLALIRDSIAEDILAAGALPLLVELLSDGSDEGMANAAEALGKLAWGKDDIGVAIMAAGAFPLLMELMNNGSDDAAGVLGILAQQLGLM